MFFLYIDPGTGSMLFSILIGVVSTIVFFGQKLILRLKFAISGGHAAKISDTKIPYVIFSDHKRYWNVFKPICDQFENRKVDLVYWTASHDDPALQEKYEHVKCEFIGEGNKAFAKLNMMNAGIVLSTTPGLDVYQWKRSKNVEWYVHIVHMINDITTYKMFGLDFYDAILCSGEYQANQIRKIEELRNLSKKEVSIVGCTYMDSLQDKLENFNSRKSVQNAKTILLAPSWGASGILSKYGKKIIKCLIDTGYNIIIRPHPQSFTAEKELMEELQNIYPENENLKWNKDDDNFQILNTADLIITDFSGIIFDYAFVFGKPVIYADTKFNPAPYDAAWIKEPLWTFRILPEIGIPLEEKQFSDMKNIIAKALTDKSLAERVKEIKKSSWMHCGESAKLTADYLIEKRRALQNKK